MPVICLGPWTDEERWERYTSWTLCWSRYLCSSREEAEAAAKAAEEKKKADEEAESAKAEYVFLA